MMTNTIYLVIAVAGNNRRTIGACGSEAAAQKVKLQLALNNAAINQILKKKEETFAQWQAKFPCEKFGPMPTPDTKGFKYFKEIFADPAYQAAMEQRRVTAAIRDTAFERFKSQYLAKEQKEFKKIRFLNEAVEMQLAKEVAVFDVVETPFLGEY